MPSVPTTGRGFTITLIKINESKRILTHTSFFVVLFMSLPYSLADMKWSLKAGMSLSVAKHPRTDMQQLMMRGSKGTGDIFLETPTYTNESVTDGQESKRPCQLLLRYNDLFLSLHKPRLTNIHAGLRYPTTAARICSHDASFMLFRNF